MNIRAEIPGSLALWKSQTKKSHRRRFFRRYPIHFFFQMFFGEADALEHAFAVLDHVGMAAEVSDGVVAVEAPEVGILAQHVVHAAAFAVPLLVVPRTAYGRRIFQPWHFSGELDQLVVVSEFPGAAGAIQEEQFLLAFEGTFFPSAIKSADVTHKR